MIRVYICPTCGWLRTVSRRTKVECFRCAGRVMMPVHLDYIRYIQMTELQRDEYAERWLYLNQIRHSMHTENEFL